MTRFRLAAALAALATPLAAAPTATAPDIAALERYISANLAYSPATRNEALRRLPHLTQLSGEQAKFELEVARILALSNNGHSALFSPQWTLRYPRSPVRFGLFADGLFVVAAPSEQSELIGKPVETINGRPWEDLRTAYADYQGGLPGFRDQFLVYFLETPAILAAAGFGETDTLELGVGGRRVRVTPRMSPYTDELEALFGRPAAREAAALVSGDLPLYLRHEDKSFHHERLPDLRASYIRLDWVRGEGLEDFLAGTLAELRRSPPRHLVLDLRFNIGGDLNITRDFAKAIPEIVPGQIYAITSGRTFSAALATLGYLKQAAGERLTIVGEPAGDRLEYWADGDIVELPVNGALLLTGEERHNYMTGCPEPDCHGSIRRHPIKVRTLQPDIRAEFTFAALRAGRDPAMEAIERDMRERASRAAP